MLHIVVNTKGGVGKTTLSQHLILPALERAIYVDTDSYNSSISKIKRSKFIIQTVKLKTMTDMEQALYDNIVLTVGELLERKENILIDAGAGAITSAVLKAILTAYPEYSFVYIPVAEETNTRATVDFVSAYTDRYILIQNMSDTADGEYIAFPNISLALPIANELQISVIELEEVDESKLSLPQRGMQRIVKSLVIPKVKWAISSVKERIA